MLPCLVSTSLFRRPPYHGVVLEDQHGIPTPLNRPTGPERIDLRDAFEDPFEIRKRTSAQPDLRHGAARTADTLATRARFEVRECFAGVVRLTGFENLPFGGTGIFTESPSQLLGLSCTLDLTQWAIDDGRGPARAMRLRSYFPINMAIWAA